MSTIKTFSDLETALANDQLCGLEIVVLRFVPDEFDHLDNCAPSEFHSWRGSYREAAFGIDNREWSTLLTRDLVQMIKRAREKTHSGWKGGEYNFYGDTQIWFGAEGVTHSSKDPNTHAYLGLADIKIENNELVLVIDYCSF